MPRKGPAPKRKLVIDPKYNDSTVTQLINRIMNDGKRSVAEKIVYDAMETIRERTGADPVQVFKKAMENTQPALEVKSRRVGGATYQVPIEVKPARGATLALR